MLRPIAVLLMLAALWPARGSADEAARPLLEIDSGGHTSLINDIAFTPDGRFLVSASDDKTIRVWDWRARKTMRTIRGEVGAGDAGKVYAMALSPDGRWLAAGGYMGAFTGSNAREEEQAHKIRLYDFASGRLIALLKGHSDVVLALAFSPDCGQRGAAAPESEPGPAADQPGCRLISGSKDTTAIIWDVEQQKQLHRLEGHTEYIYAVGFVPLAGRRSEVAPATGTFLPTGTKSMNGADGSATLRHAHK